MNAILLRLIRALVRYIIYEREDTPQWLTVLTKAQIITPETCNYAATRKDFENEYDDDADPANVIPLVRFDPDSPGGVPGESSDPRPDLPGD